MFRPLHLFVPCNGSAEFKAITATYIIRPVCINYCLTPGKYDVAMGNKVLRQKSGIWLALLIALGLHGLMLLLPLSGQKTGSGTTLARIELQLIKPEPSAEAKEILLAAPEPPPSPARLTTPMVQEISAPSVKTPPDVVAPTRPAATLIPIERDPELMSTAEKRRLTHTILSSQFITEESAADQLFGKSLAHNNFAIREEFHYPERDNLVTILTKPMQELPFEYRPGLIHFAYDPGVRGDLQRFWDTITPEFGWITKYGTEVKCKWILVIAGCGWK